ncbi:MAG: hypothetical protein R6V28_11505 [Nitriliruptoraceae bacterium]
MLAFQMASGALRAKARTARWPVAGSGNGDVRTFRLRLRRLQSHVICRRRSRPELAGLTVLHHDKDFDIIADVTGQPLERLHLDDEL